MCQPHVLVVTSCTGQKRFKSENQLTLEDFKDNARLPQREAELAEFACPANQMYTGQQHLRAMEGVGLLRQSLGREAVDVVILSAGYGLIPEDRTIVPYQVTFNRMKGDKVDEWAAVLGIHQAFERAIADYDLVFLLLGKNYLRSLSLPVEISSTHTLVFLASKTSAKYIRELAAKTLVFTLSNVEAKRYRYGLVGLKGFLFKRFAQWVSQETQLLQKVYQEPEVFRQVMEREPVQLELPLELPKIRYSVKSVNTRKKRLSEKTDFFPIPDLPQAPNWHLGMQYFIPEWDDRVDPGYNFQTDTFTAYRDAYLDDIYSHQIYNLPNYDGVLVSKVVVDKSKKKKEFIQRNGIHDFVRFSGKIMGDCGAFGYIKESEPPYTTDEILDYYEQLGFNYGVSIDHLIVGPFAQSGVKEKRYNLTLKNAEEFIQKHRAGNYHFTPIGVAQGWNPDSYSKAVKDIIGMGYDYVALGGLARTPSHKIIEILEAISPYLTPNTRMHLFGVGRINATPAFRHLGVTSFDSASALRSAWLDSAANYHTISGKQYAAVRIPPVERSGLRVKRVLEAGISDRETLKRLEENSLKAIREFDAEKLTLEETIDILLAYDELLELPRDGQVNPEAKARRLSKHEKMYRELLTDKPWKSCDCQICQDLGIDVVIFRGNDRNRRRGFHNTFVFYKRFKRLFKD